jgi:hypothetical protein
MKLQVELQRRLREQSCTNDETRPRGAVDYVAHGFTGDRDQRREGLSKTKRAAILATRSLSPISRSGSRSTFSVLRIRLGFICDLIR